jgi:protein gp37
VSAKTGISWTDATWNPIRGCSRVSEGCRNCYAERMAARFSGPGQPYEGLVKIVTRTHERATLMKTSAQFSSTTTKEPRWSGVVRLVPEHLGDPLRWKKPRRIFVNSMSDMFHENLTNEQIAAVFGVMAAAPQHTFQVLTKRARRMREWFEWFREEWRADELNGDRIDRLATWAADELGDGSEGDQERWFERVRGMIQDAHGFQRDVPWPLQNVWIGVSVENQAAADERIPELLATPAAVRFLSCEPLIGPVDLRRRLGQRTTCKEHGEDVRVDEDGCCATCGLDALWYGVDWVIAGCESGPGARPCDVAWLRHLRDQCAGAGVPLFLKQAVATFETAEVRWVPFDDSGRDPVRVLGVDDGPGSKAKAGGVIELPYLDGVQHAAFPGVPDAR